MTHQELSEAVAKKLGWTEKKGLWFRPKPDVAIYYKPWDYCTDIAAAWEIVEFITKESERKQTGPLVELVHDGCWHFKIGLVQQNADTAPMAICLAFLKLEEK